LNCATLPATGIFLPEFLPDCKADTGYGGGSCCSPPSSVNGQKRKFFKLSYSFSFVNTEQFQNILFICGKFPGRFFIFTAEDIGISPVFQ
jgi:hypothetical protein